MKTEAEFRAYADACRKREQESFDRSDTDGCVSQWCSSLSAREADARADIVRDGNRAVFSGLYEGDRRVKAKVITSQFGNAWLLDDSEGALIRKRGQKFLPTGSTSRVLKKLGLQQRPETAPAWACLDGSGHGISGLTSCYIKVYRTGCQWGSDAALCEEE